MTKFEIKEVLKQVISILDNHPNHADYEYLMRLAQELHQKVRENATCGSCTYPCGNEHCPVQLELKEKKCQK